MQTPYKILDAPQLTDDFYLNLVDWGNKNNKVGVALGDALYLWDPLTNQADNLWAGQQGDTITAVGFSRRDAHLVAVGLQDG